MAPPHDELGGNRQFMGGQHKCLSGALFRNAFHLIENSTGPNHGHPVFGRAFPFSHPGLSRFLGNGFIGKDSDPDAPRSFNEAGHSNSGSFDLSRSQPAAFDGLEPKISKVEHISSGGLPSPFS